ncbi:uncharacterized protein LOC129800269 [Phlebotomus papatasi]|uniref:uncharacterized protein LOC129800269 n=1 Tax=Phlebotomus papatasi TaxID=29031 RepID=UPI002483C5FF|nr:uncharacterized protein LOC129800269 [Phlebotomus papatasi]
MYHDITTQVLSLSGVGERFGVRVGVHQESALSPLLFNAVIVYLTSSIQIEVLWTLLHADYVVLMDKTRDHLQCRVDLWKEALEGGLFKISRSRTEYMHLNFSGSTKGSGSLSIR